MKKLLVLSTTLLPLLILSLNGFTQPPAPFWVSKYNPANKGDEVRAMTVDASGNIYVTGPSDISKKVNRDYATVKYDRNGNQKWVSRYNGTGNSDEYPEAIAVDADKNVYITGASVGLNSDYDFATIKYDSNGLQQWVARFNGPANMSDAAQDIKVDGAGNVYVTGFCDGSANNLLSGNACYTVKYNRFGGELWHARYDATASTPESSNSLALAADGNVYVTGKSNNSMVTIKYDSTGGQIWTRSNGGVGGLKILVDGENNIVVTGDGSNTIKYDASGNLLWQVAYPGGGGDAFSDMASDPTGNIYVTGFGRPLNGIYSDYMTVKYDHTTGSQVWSKRYNGSANSTDFARSIALDNSGNVYVTGHSTDIDGRNTKAVFATIKYNNAGDEQWVARYDGDGFAVAVDPSGDVIVGGQSYTRTTGEDFTTIKYLQGSLATKTRSPQPAIFGLTNYPNPFSGSTTIEYKLPHDGNVKIVIYDLLGSEITMLANEAAMAGLHRINFSADKLTTGIYLLIIQAGEFSESRRLVVAK